jgi:type IV pilus assembly protein PilE
MTTISSARTGRARGFTLIELVVTMLVVATLAAVAVASYRSQVRKSRRTDAKTALLDLAGREERNFSTTNAYTAVPAQLGYTGAWPLSVGSGYYTVTVAVTAGAPGVPATFNVTATAVGDQASDKCTSYYLDQTGVQASNGSTTTDALNCWR